MNNPVTPVERHYGRANLLDTILQALRQAGKDPDRLTPEDLAPVDEFHIRGREGTVELAVRAGLSPGQRVLDVGSGLGGSARYLASEYRCRVTGVDLTPEYVDVAAALTDRVGLADRVEFHQGSALALPFDAGSFDVVWTEHVQMNIADKGAFYGELARVLEPGGRLAFHDIFQGPGGDPHFPVPWAGEPALSSLAPPNTIRATLGAVGLAVRDWEDQTAKAAMWLRGVMDKVRESGPPPVGIHLLMGDTARAKLENVLRNLEEGRITVVQAVADKG